MTTDEFATLLERFSQRPLPASTTRHVYLWAGSAAWLHAHAGADCIAHLDLVALAAILPRTPDAMDAAMQLLTVAIQAWLRQHAPSPGRQQLIAVSGCSLLARYRVPLAAFFQVASERRMVVCVVPPGEFDYHPQRHLPAYIEVKPRATLDYLSRLLDPGATIGVVPV